MIIMNIKIENVCEVAVREILNLDPLLLILSAENSLNLEPLNPENSLNLEPLNLIPPAGSGITNSTWKNLRLLLQITAQLAPHGPSNPHSTSNKRPISAEKGLPNSTWTFWTSFHPQKTTFISWKLPHILLQNPLNLIPPAKTHH